MQSANTLGETGAAGGNTSLISIYTDQCNHMGDRLTEPDPCLGARNLTSLRPALLPSCNIRIQN